MFIVTNRELIPDAKGTAQFGPIPSRDGANNLRVAEVTKAGRGWSVTILPDVIGDDMREELTKKFKGGAGLEPGQKLYASHYASAKMIDRARREKKNLLFFVHGFNNNIDDILQRAHDLEKTYGVLVVCFSWPARGGGARGLLSYRQDKRDAKASVCAFERFLVSARGHMDRLNGKAKEDCMRHANEKYPENFEERDMLFEELMAKACPVRLTLMLHSMGNYLLKQTLLSSTSDEIGSLFDNVVLVAADTNNAGHPAWVDRIRARESILIVINENDRALRASEVKVGEAQRGRLGRLRRRLDSQLALYVDVTEAPNVGQGHAYFEGKPVAAKTGVLRRFFTSVFNGNRADDVLDQDPTLGIMRIAGTPAKTDPSPPRRRPVGSRRRP